MQIYYIVREGDDPYFAMEFVAGGSLQQRVADRGALPPAEALDVFTQAARGLAGSEVHAGRRR